MHWMNYLLFCIFIPPTIAWNCAGLCWVNPNQESLESFHVKDYTQFWNCDACTTVSGCTDFENPYRNASTCYGENIIDLCSPPLAENVYVGPLLNISSDFYFCDWEKSLSCANNFYRNSNQCINCLFNNPTSCVKGQYPTRCRKNFGSECTSCSIPALLNKTVHQYGYGMLYENCMSMKEPNSPLPVLSSILHADKGAEYWTLFFEKCAFTQTPKWDQGYCYVECREGYTMTRAAQHVHDVPECTPCQKNCPLGTMSSTCLGQSYIEPGDNAGSCRQCDNTLPAFAHWTGQNCEWNCDNGYFHRDNSCRICNENNISCTAPSYYLNCTHFSEGSCESCYKVCNVDYYLSVLPWQSDCECLPCSQPTLGVTFVITNCTISNHDTKLGNCMNDCPVGTFMKTNCSLYSDSLCVLCKAPVMGLLLVKPCSKYEDAQYALCPTGYACNGSTLLQICPVHLRAVDGMCVCPLGMQFGGVQGLCIPTKCASGTYFDLISGMCLNCSDFHDISRHLTIHPHSNPNIIGISACYCPPHYFVHLISDFLMRCVPCGDLGCKILDFEIQTKCSGRTSLEPQCVCSTPPGIIQKSNQSMCRDQMICKSQYLYTGTSLGDYEYENFNFFYASTIFQQKHWNLSILTKPQKILQLNSEYVLSIVDGKILLNRISTFESDFLDISWISEVNSEKRQSVGIYVTDIQLHERKDYTISEDSFRIWISFSYKGLCDNNEDTIQDCSAIELFSLFPRTIETQLTFCNLELCFNWHTPLTSDHRFLTEGVHMYIDKFVFGREEDSDYFVYFLVESHTLMKHPLRFSQASPSQGFEILYSIPEQQRPFSRILDISTGVRGLYVLLQRDELTVDLKVIYSRSSLIFFTAFDSAVHIYREDEGIYQATSLKSLTYHLLLVGGTYANFVLDLWNRFDSSFFPFGLELFENPNIVVSPFNPIVSQDFPTYYQCVLYYNGTWTLFKGITFCPPDYFYYSSLLQSKQECELGFCVAKEPCGPNTFREFTSNQCQCIPGYQVLWDSKGKFAGCKACKATNNEYCTGHLNPSQACPINSLVYKDLATSSDECYCLPGFFKLLGGCSQCSVNVFCPFQNMLIPVPCNHLGLTEYAQQTSPQYCFCPPRTWGLTCIPCLHDEICPVLDSPSGLSPFMELWMVEFYGYIHNYLDFTFCMDEYVDKALDAYTLYVIPKGYSSEVDSNFLNLSTNEYIYFKVLVHFKEKDNLFKENINICMKYRNVPFSITYSLIQKSFRPTLYREKKNCGILNRQSGYWEWNGLVDSQLEECTCIPGYEPVSVDEGQWTTSIKCYPCLNGTHRSRGTAARCIPCVDKEREHAPYLAMSECVCKPGFVRSPITLRCELASQEYASFKQSPPEWYSIMSVQFNVIIIASSISVAVLIFISVFVYFIF